MEIFGHFLSHSVIPKLFVYQQNFLVIIIINFILNSVSKHSTVQHLNTGFKSHIVINNNKNIKVRKIELKFKLEAQYKHTKTCCYT